MNLTWIEISKAALLNNIEQIKKRIPKKTKYIAVIKSNAYGHGILQVVNTIKSKVDAFGVYDFNDAILLREKKITKTILMMGRVFESQLSAAVKNNIEVSVSTLDILETSKKVKIHICVDTGLGRDGFISGDMEKALELLAKNKNIEVKGLYTHFAAPDESAYNPYTKKQIEKLNVWKEALKKIGLTPATHISSTAGAFINEFDCCLDAVRIGGGTYGLWSSNEVYLRSKTKTKLIPVLSWKSTVTEIKSLSRGCNISYGCTFSLKRDSKVAILPVGYFDGIPRIASAKGYVMINGVKAPQLGRVTMNMIVVDVTDVKKIKIGDEAIIIGKGVTAEDWGFWSGSFNYEITTRINSNIPRKLV